MPAAGIDNHHGKSESIVLLPTPHKQILIISHRQGLFWSIGLSLILEKDE